VNYLEVFGGDLPAHFFMHCPEYNNRRQTLKHTFTKLNINFNLQTILNGCETLNYHQNEELLDIQLFIKNEIAVMLFTLR
jgi:hypothetical protein